MHLCGLSLSLKDSLTFWSARADIFVGTVRSLAQWNWSRWLRWASELLGDLGGLDHVDHVRVEA
jgi:hypothetical protein